MNIKKIFKWFFRDDNLQLKGRVQISDKSGKILFETSNLVVDIGLNLVCNLLASSTGYTGLNFCSLGTSDAAVNSSDTQLGAETSREQISTIAVLDNEIIIMTYFLAAICSINIHELGLFGNGATYTLNSGTLISHASATYDNSITPQDLVITWALTLTAV